MLPKNEYHNQIFVMIPYKDFWLDKFIIFIEFATNIVQQNSNGLAFREYE